MAKILMLTAQPPYPPQQGTSLRNWHLLRALAEIHDVALLTFRESGGPFGLEVLETVADVLPPVETPTRTKAKRLEQLIISSQPDIALRLASENFQTQLQKAISSGAFDAFQIEGIELARYIPIIRGSCPAVRIILDCHNAETELQRRALETDLPHPARWPAAVYSWIQVGRLRDFEKKVCLAADRIIAVSEADRAHLNRLLAPETKAIEVIPNTIDVTEYSSGEQPDDRNYRFDLLFTGKMDYRPNVDGVLWFANEVWPRIQDELPGVTWGIVGQNPHPRLDQLRNKPGIVLTGWVQDIRPYLVAATIYITPLRIGSGTRLKLIEAMSAHKPIVSTTIGAEGFPIRNGEELIIADTPAEMAQAVVALLGDSARRERLGEAAFRLAQQYDWRNTIPQLERLYAGLIKPE